MNYLEKLINYFRPKNNTVILAEDHKLYVLGFSPMTNRLNEFESFRDLLGVCGVDVIASEVMGVNDDGREFGWFLIPENQVRSAWSAVEETYYANLEHDEIALNTSFNQYAYQETLEVVTDMVTHYVGNGVIHDEVFISAELVDKYDPADSFGLKRLING